MKKFVPRFGKKDGEQQPFVRPKRKDEVLATRSPFAHLLSTIESDRSEMEAIDTVDLYMNAQFPEGNLNDVVLLREESQMLDQQSVEFQRLTKELDAEERALVNEWLVLKTKTFFEALQEYYDAVKASHEAASAGRSKGYPPNVGYGKMKATGYEYVDAIRADMDTRLQELELKAADGSEESCQYINQHLQETHKRMIRICAMMFSFCLEALEQQTLQVRFESFWLECYFFFKRNKTMPVEELIEELEAFGRDSKVDIPTMKQKYADAKLQAEAKMKEEAAKAMEEASVQSYDSGI